jgi:hypothetical protein
MKRTSIGYGNYLLQRRSSRLEQQMVLYIIIAPSAQKDGKVEMFFSCFFRQDLVGLKYPDNRKAQNANS